MFPQAGLVPHPVDARLHGTMGAHKGCPYDDRGAAQAIFIVNASRSDRRPPDKGGWGVTCFPRRASSPTLWMPACTGPWAPTRDAPTTVGGAAQAIFIAKANGSRSDRRPPDKGGWGVTCFPRRASSPTLWMPACTGPWAPTRDAPTTVGGAARAIFIVRTDRVRIYWRLETLTSAIRMLKPVKDWLKT